MNVDKAINYGRNMELSQGKAAGMECEFHS